MAVYAIAQFSNTVYYYPYSIKFGELEVGNSYLLMLVCACVCCHKNSSKAMQCSLNLEPSENGYWFALNDIKMLPVLMKREAPL